MRWRLWRRNPDERLSAARERADQAMQLSLEQAAEAKRHLVESQRLAARFRELRQKNHFAEAFSRALRN